MRGKFLSIAAAAVFIAVFCAASQNASASDVSDPNALIGRWEGSARGTNFS